MTPVSKNCTLATLALALLLAANSSALGQWVSVGPAGAVLGLMKTDSLLYAYAPGFGIAVSADEGYSWRLANDGLGNRTVMDMTAMGSTVFATTLGSGIYASTNQGHLWYPASDYLISLHVGAIKAIGGKLYCAPVKYGVFVSSDTGSTWQPAGKGLAVISVTCFLELEGVLYAGTEVDGVYRSLDTGKTWQVSSAGLPKRGITCLAAIGKKLIAGTYGAGPFQSTDGALTWTRAGYCDDPVPVGGDPLLKAIVTSLVAAPRAAGGINLVMGTINGIVYTTRDTATTWHSSSLTPSSEAVTALEVGANSTLYAGYGDGIMRSTDGGEQWLTLGGGIPTSDVRVLLTSDGMLYAGTYTQGLFRSASGGNIWSRMNEGLKDLGISALAAKDSLLFVGTRTDGLYERTEADTGWRPVRTLQEPAINAIQVSGDLLLVGAIGNGGYLSTDVGVSWQKAQGFVTDMAGTSVTGFTSIGTTLFAGSDSKGMFRSMNGGKNWSMVNYGLGNTSALACASYDNLVYAGTGIGIYCSTNAGGGWFDAGLTGRVTCLLSGRWGLLAGVYGKGIYISTNGGEVWESVSQGLTSGFVQCLASDGQMLYAGTATSGTWRRAIDEMLSTLNVSREQNLPGQFVLEQNYPNPFNPVTTIHYTIGQREWGREGEGEWNVPVQLIVYDLLGRQVAVLVNEPQAPGRYSVQFDGKALASGVYFYRLQAGGSSYTKRLLLLR